MKISGYNEELEFGLFENMRRSPTDIRIHFWNYSDWLEHVDALYDCMTADSGYSTEDNYRNYRFYMENKLRNNERSLKSVEIVLIPIYIALFTVFIEADIDISNLEDIVSAIGMVALLIVAIAGSLLAFFKYSKRVDYYQTMVDIASSEEFKRSKGISVDC